MWVSRDINVPVDDRELDKHLMRMLKILFRLFRTNLSVMRGIESFTILL